ncbi:hypothetical protein SSBR45G_32210 [Bradyrhizobium sp. SSBR45G]|nr:hypothetical protein SSBR45G_32210 [Bradyrhizobium sp. SSBR45G]GLH86095.1 hypothetical protein SSBR45R_35550 [Bradyrhizobium sp. SSBR45R]
MFAGWNVQLSRAVLGAQLEATMADLDSGNAGSRSYAYFNSGGPTGMGARGDFRPQITTRWMTSALLRAGVLVDPQTLLYGLGGWTFAKLDARNLTDNAFFQPNETVWVNGPMAGLGLERKLGAHWSFRTEYRYTKFNAARTQDQTSFVANFGSQQYWRATQYDLSMQSARIGFAYLIDPLE